ncbi:MAG: hypothetical protein NTZ33_06630 [Bacteroidetes bacterium]|nr:hypothetical protein [Bacteroidota bacterium]
MIVFCVAAGLIYAGILYYKNKSSMYSPLLQKSMAVLRFLTVFLLAFLLLSPLIKIVTQNNEKPVIVVVQDNSQSIAVAKDSLFYKTEYRKKLESLISTLEKKYEVKTFSFDDKMHEELNFAFNGKQTDISNVFDELITRYTNRNIGAIILASDGIYNKGSNPLYVADKIKVPFYTIALGDTSVHKDLLIQKVNFNRITYLGNTFPLEILVNANKAKGLSSKLIVKHGEKEIFNKTINFSSDEYIETVNVVTEAKESGLQRYTISITPVSGELTLSNNRKDIFIEVLDARQKILILAAYPHPDVSAIKQSLENNKNYEVEVSLANDFNKTITDYNLVILHQLPAITVNSSRIFNAIQKTNLPLLYILGAQSNITQFNTLQSGLNIVVKNQNYNDALPSVSNEFSYFTVSDECRKMLNNFPPLSSPFGNYQQVTSAEPFIMQKIGNIVSNQPLILFNQSLNNKTGIITGEGLWKWKLANYAQRNNTEAFDEIICKTVQYLSVKVDKGLFRVIGNHVFNENQAIEFDAELYNDSYELVNDADLNLIITNKEGKKFPYQFSKTSNAYHLNAGSFPVGDYKYQSTVKQKSKTLTQNGSFTVVAEDIEFVNTVANHQLLYNIAKKHGGEMLYPNELDKLTDLLNNREDIKVVKYTQKRFNDLVNLYWILILIIALLTSEWFLRKRNGGY